MKNYFLRFISIEIVRNFIWRQKGINKNLEGNFYDLFVKFVEEEWRLRFKNNIFQLKNSHKGEKRADEDV